MAVAFQERIQVLHVDDEPDFTDLTATFLEREDDRFTVETATSADEGVERISDRPPDCVVSDYNMPGMDGIEFLRAVREEHPDLPFILYTGKGSEAVASDAIAADVTDYLQKETGSEQYELLANRIRNAVQARRDAERATRQEQLMRLTEFAGDTGGFELDRGSDTILLTAGTRRIIGRPDQPEIPLQEAIELFHPGDQENIQHTLTEAFQTGEELQKTWRLQRADGDERLLNLTITPVVENGEVTKLRGVGNDITDQHERQQELRRNKHAMDEAPVGITISDPSQDDHPLVYVNDRFEELTGYDEDETIGRNCRFLQADDTREEPVARMREAIVARDPVTVELRNYHKDGTEFWNRVSIAPVRDEEGSVVNFVGFQQDITDQKQRERRLTELNQVTQALLTAETSQEVADIGVEAAGDVLDLQANAIHVSEADDRRLVPAAQTDVLASLIGDTQPLPVANSVAGRVYRNGEPAVITDVQQDPDVHDSETTLGAHLYLPLGDHGILIAGSEKRTAFDQQDLELGELLAGTLVAALDRVKREETARQRQQQLSLFFDESPLGAVQWDDEFRFERVNERAEEILGYDEEALCGKSWETIVTDEDSDHVGDVVENLLAYDGGTHVLNTNVRKDGEVITCEWHNRAVTDADGDVQSIFSKFQDVTDRKERQQELERTQDLMANMEQLADVGAWEYDPETDRLMLTDGTRRIHGLDPGTDLTLEAAFETFHPDDRDLLTDRFDECLETGEPYEMDVRLTTPGGDQRWITARGERVTGDESGDVVRGYIQDITEQKQVERDLRQERDLVTGIVETTPVGISVVSADGDLSFVNEQSTTIAGWSSEEVEDVSFNHSRYDNVNEDGDSFDAGDTPFGRVLSQETAIHDQVVGTRRPSGERVWLSVSGAPQYNDSGELERAVFAFEDITEQWELEAELSEILGRISDGFFALDEEYRVTHLNDRGEKLLEASADELLGETLWDMHPEIEESDEMWDSLHAAMDTQTTQSPEVHSEPTDRWYDVTVYPSESGVSVYFRDVSEQKKREQELQELKNQYQTLVENFPNGAVFLFDADLQYVRAGGAELDATYAAPGEIEGATAHDIFPEQLADELVSYYDDALDGNSHTFTRTIGGETYRTWTVPVRIGDEDIDYGMGMSQNITDRIERRRELERQNERLEEFASIVSHDLRSPLIVAEGHLELARDTCESDHLTRAAGAIDRSQALIEDLLTLARLGEEVSEVEPVELADVVENSWHTVKIESAPPETCGTRVIQADRSRLKQLFENLYRNAVEHSDDNVTLSVGVMDDGFYVADTGPGIPESDREEVFEAGYSTNEEGTGFGLRIVEQIADAHGWEVTVTESEHGGARFEITGVEFAHR